MKAADRKDEAGDRTSLKEVPRAGNKKNEADDLQDHRDVPVPEAVSVKDAPPASPVRFYARLRRDLADRGVDASLLERLTAEGDHPPCFETAMHYEAWLASASLLGATVPYRYDMPAEPNYCWDCTPEFKRASQAAGLCRFPNTRFEKCQTVVQDDEGKGIEIELVGVSRSKMVAIDLRSEYDPPEEN